jgi:hypothetical protein
MSPNGTHQRPQADGSARGRDGRVNAKTLSARGRALYVSRFAAWVCWAAYAASLLCRALYSLGTETRRQVGLYRGS